MSSPYDNVIVKGLQSQRNQALDEVVQVLAEKAVLQAENAELKQKLLGIN